MSKIESELYSGVYHQGASDSFHGKLQKMYKDLWDEGNLYKVLLSCPPSKPEV